MTREETIEFGKLWLEVNENCKGSSTYAFFQQGIKALEQDPCEDAISRRAVRYILNHQVKMPIKVWKKLFKLVDELPAIIPQQEIGRWEDCSNGWMCSECDWSSNEDTKYCPNCGAKMIESEDKEWTL